MTIDQRNAGASVTPANGLYTLDRWQSLQSPSGKYSVQQNAGSVTPPAGFKNYLGITSLSAYTVTTGDYFILRQPIEGLNVFDLAWGTANASSVTVSFWVRSSLTGTFGGSVNNAAENYSYPFGYTISSANTWEYKTITIAGPTSGTWLTTNGCGLNLNFSLGVNSAISGTAGAWAAANYQSVTGATSVVGTNGATFYITGVQLEKGSTATPFEFRSIGQEEILCYRYFQKYSVSWRPYCENGNFVSCFVPIQTMRVAPTASRSGGSFTSCTFAALENITTNGFRYTLQGTSSTMVEVLNDVTLLNGEL
jgi:hypothetical protein